MDIDVYDEGSSTVYSCGDYVLPSNIKNLTLIGGKVINTRLSSGKEALVYGNPFEWSRYLDYAQGDNSYGFKSNCGIVACENVLIQSGGADLKISYKPGKDLLETEIVSTAITLSACTIYWNPYYSGGTTYLDRAEILDYYDVAMSITPEYNLYSLGQALKDNKCVIAGVSSLYLWYGYQGVQDHAIIVTGVAYNNLNEIEGFYICDSGRGLKSDANRFITYSMATQAIKSFCATNSSIKVNIEPLSGYGNILDNAIFGNAGNNKIYGLDGDDTLDGAYGGDTLVGGQGDDIYQIDKRDYVVEYKNEGNDTVVANFDYMLSEKCNIENIVLIYTAKSAYGNSFDNFLTGNNFSNILVGNSGNDTLSGGINSDTLDGGAGDDTYLFNIGDGIDTIIEENKYWKQGWCFLVPQEDNIRFGDSIIQNNVVFTKNNDDLNIHYSNLDYVIVKNQLGNCLTRVEKLELNNGNYLTDMQISDIIQKMSVFAGNNNIDISNYEAVKNDPYLISLINTAWVNG